MAIDQALLDLAVAEGRSVLRLYHWNPHCLSFGRHEPARRRYDRGRVEAMGLDVVRRPTGGRAVWHARELTYALAAPTAGVSLRQVYRAVHAMLADAIGALGVPVVLAPEPDRTPRPADGPCFAAPVGGELLWRGRKVVGSAQLRAGDAFLQHGSVLLLDDQSLVRAIALGGGGDAAEVPLAAALGRPIGFSEAAGAVASAATRWAESVDPFAPAATLARAGAHADRFKSPAWTWER